MNRFQRQLEKAQLAVNEMQDEHRITCHELRDSIAECKRLRFQIYGPQPMDFQNALVRAEERAVDRRARPSACECFFDVTKWKWVAIAIIPYRVAG